MNVMNVTNLTSEECGRCGSLLFPPHLAPGIGVPATADFVCPTCGRAYQWAGSPPRLGVVAPLMMPDEDDDDPACLCRLSPGAALPLQPRGTRGVAGTRHLRLVVPASD
jgi:hypothetical protein